MNEKIGLLIIDHGSRKQGANEVVIEIASLVHKMSNSLIVQHAHMELATPTIQQAFDRFVEAGVHNIIVQPYFLGPGRHSTSDIPKMVGEIVQKHPKISVQIGAPLGVHRKMAELVLERVREADRLEFLSTTVSKS